MEGKCRDGLVGVAIHPCFSDGGIVYRKDLDEALPCTGCPINQSVKIRELSNSKPGVSSKRENRNRNTRSTPTMQRVAKGSCGYHHFFILNKGRQEDVPIRPSFPHYHLAILVEHHELELQRQ